MPAIESVSSDEGPVDLPVGKIVSKRWMILKKIGEGGCGSVYIVQDRETKKKYALKAESNFTTAGAVLKLEVEILRRLGGKRKNFGQLIHAGKRVNYSYMVMTLFGPSLSKLLHRLKRPCSISTQTRIGIQLLHCIKTLHELGYIHRDVKPSNLAIGRHGSATRVIFMLDFGLAREFVRRENGRVLMRRPRAETLFRGTTRYCSINTHNHNDQSRVDDLWSMMYVLIELRGALPWQNFKDKKEVLRIKSTTSDAQLLFNSPVKLLNIINHLRTLNYFTRPNYFFIYRCLLDIMNDGNFKWTAPYDWEPRLSRTFERLIPHSTRSTTDSSDVVHEPSSKETSQFPYTDSDFASCELGF
ncbi:hypothetical protein M3Y94_00585600 [Aphelenchoides besseyi]|nr:hypothetical protein M3Y94_00585600 [Aphelenchoides besseyi]